MSSSNRKTIPISYYNFTGRVDFEVMVYSRNHNRYTPIEYEVAWRVLRGQGSVDFEYPFQLQVGATYYQNENEAIHCGPLDAEPGSTWEIIQNRPRDTPVMQQVFGVPKNDNGTIVIKNTQPTTWDGRKYHIGLFRDHRLLMQGRNVHVGQQMNFIADHLLHFAVARNVSRGEHVHIGEVTSYQTEFDVNKYPTGMNVFLTMSPGGGKYKFTAYHKMP